MNRIAPVMLAALLAATLLIAGLSAVEAQAQPFRVSGLVVGADNGRPLARAEVVAVETGDSTTTLDNGRFSLVIQPQGMVTLTFSASGYKTVTKQIDMVTSGLIVSMQRAQ